MKYEIKGHKIQANKDRKIFIEYLDKLLTLKLKYTSS